MASLSLVHSSLEGVRGALVACPGLEYFLLRGDERVVVMASYPFPWEVFHLRLARESRIQALNGGHEVACLQTVASGMVACLLVQAS